MSAVFSGWLYLTLAVGSLFELTAGLVIVALALDMWRWRQHGRRQEPVTDPFLIALEAQLAATPRRTRIPRAGRRG